MFCKKGIFINWGNIPHLEFDFGPVNLFSGGNGSGKTTAADGIQSLMTAAHENLFTYNPGQDETTQKGRGGKQVRTLASYILGCDDGSYARPRVTDGYVAGVFNPTQGEAGERFTAIMCVRASLDSAGSSRQARQDDLVFIIIPNEELNIHFFVREDKGGKYIIPQADLIKLLKKEFGQSAVEVYDKKGAYLRRLYGIFQGKKGAVSDREAKHAARTFSNFMAYKPVKSINDFVAKEILEPKDLSEDIRQVSELMKTIHSMEDEARQVKDAIDSLHSAKQLADHYVDDWVGLCVGRYAESARQYILQQESYLQNKYEQRINQDAINDTEQRLKSNGDKKSALHAQLVNLEAQRQGVSALKDKDELEKDIENRHQLIAEQARPLLEQNHQFTQNYQALKQLQQKLSQSSLAVDIPALDKKEFHQAIKQLLSQGEHTDIDAQKLLTTDWVGVADLESKLDGIMARESVHRQVAQQLHDAAFNSESQSVRDQMVALAHKRKDEQNQLYTQLNSKRKEIATLENHRVNYPAHIEAAVTAIEEQCPQANPCVLCDFIDITDPQWQMVIEGYMGGARYSIVVDPDYEAQAIRIVKNLKGRRNNARVIQGTKAQRDANKVHLPKGSIVEVMTFEHKVVEYYVKASYGNVIRVDSEDTLRKTARGVTANGLGSGNYSMFRCELDDAELVFGQGARERALLAKQNQLDHLQISNDQSEKNYRQIASMVDLIEAVKPIRCTDIIQQMLAAYRALEQAQRALQNLDLSDFQELEDALARVQEEFARIDKTGDSLQKKVGELDATGATLERKIKHLADEQERLLQAQDAAEANVLEISKVYADFDEDAALKRADERARQAGATVDLSEENNDTLVRLSKTERGLYERVMEYNQKTQSYSAVMYQLDGEVHGKDYFAGIVGIHKAVDLAHHRLKNNMLVDKIEKITALKDSFNTAFVTNLCHSIYQSINDGKRILDELNKELEHHRFGADQERFYFGYQWVPEFYEYQRFFKDVISMPSLGDGSTLFDTELSDKSSAVRDRLLAMLLDNDSQKALRELNRLSDYRHYREYEIFKEPLNKQPIALSTYGTGSGGQLETPAYIIRSAAITSAFKFNEGHTHCRMVLVDEAFSKMDETRSREVISYLTETLGLQLVFIMPTSKSGPFMDLISHQVVFSKCPAINKIGELNTQVLVDRKVCNKEKIAKLWADHRRVVRDQGMLDFMEDFV